MNMSVTHAHLWIYLKGSSLYQNNTGAYGTIIVYQIVPTNTNSSIALVQVSWLNRIVQKPNVLLSL